MSQVADWSKEVDEDEEVESSPPPASTNRQPHPSQDSRQTQESYHRDSHQRDGYQRESKPRDGMARDAMPRERIIIQAPTDGPSPFMSTVSNLPFKASPDDIGYFFVDGGCKVCEVIIHFANERPSGSAFVYFDDEESMRHSLDANNADFGGRPIRVTANRNKPRYDKPLSNRRPEDSRGQRDSRPDLPPRRPVPDTPAETEDVWTRKRIVPRPAPVVEVKQPVQPPQPPPERKALDLKPRTAPIEDIGKPVASTSIFGEGKPRDETALEVSDSIHNRIIKYLVVINFFVEKEERKSRGCRSSCACCTCSGGPCDISAKCFTPERKQRQQVSKRPRQV
jgi:RNA recognition motif. (a.k.a. RRM, RBD, or RNP domain)